MTVRTGTAIFSVLLGTIHTGLSIIGADCLIGGFPQPGPSELGNVLVARLGGTLEQLHERRVHAHEQDGGPVGRVLTQGNLLSV
jgi:hypothetical protein